MGRWTSLTKMEKPHVHDSPNIDEYDSECPGPGSIWACRCGLDWVLIAVEADRDNSVLSWPFTFYGKEYGFLSMQGLGH